MNDATQMAGQSRLKSYLTAKVTFPNWLAIVVLAAFLGDKVYTSTQSTGNFIWNLIVLTAAGVLIWIGWCECRGEGEMQIGRKEATIIYWNRVRGVWRRWSAVVIVLLAISDVIIDMGHLTF